jgi:hypothetical protein
MRPHILIFALLASLALVAPAAAAEGPVPTDTVAGEVPPKPPLKLTEEQKQRVVQAIGKENTLAKAPEGFAPAIGAHVPIQSKLPGHPLPRPLVYEIPALKNYYYVKLDDRVLIVDPMTKTVAEIAKR